MATLINELENIFLEGQSRSGRGQGRLNQNHMEKYEKQNDLFF